MLKLTKSIIDSSCYRNFNLEFLPKVRPLLFQSIYRIRNILYIDLASSINTAKTLDKITFMEILIQFSDIYQKFLLHFSFANKLTKTDNNIYWEKLKSIFR